VVAGLADSIDALVSLMSGNIMAPATGPTMGERLITAASKNAQNNNIDTMSPLDIKDKGQHTWPIQQQQQQQQVSRPDTNTHADIAETNRLLRRLIDAYENN
jgi:hypothetical protein